MNGTVNRNSVKRVAALPLGRYARSLETQAVGRTLAVAAGAMAARRKVGGAVSRFAAASTSYSGRGLSRRARPSAKPHGQVAGMRAGSQPVTFPTQ